MKLVNSCLSQSLLNQAIGILFDYDERWFEFFYSHKGGSLRLEPDELLRESRCFSRGEQVMIRIALDFWSDGRYAGLSEIVDELDWVNLTRVLIAIMKVRDVSTEDLIELGSRYEG